MICVMALSFSCRDYLDIVPDNVLTLDNIYSNREQAIQALAKTYSYMPKMENVIEQRMDIGR